MKSPGTEKDLSPEVLKREIASLQGEKRRLLAKYHKSEKALRHIRDLLAQLPLPVAVIAEDYSVVFANEECAKLFGITAHDDSPCYEHLHGREQPCPRCNIGFVLDAAGPRKVKAELPGGGTVECLAKPIDLTDGRRAVLNVYYKVSPAPGRDEETAERFSCMVAALDAQICQIDQELRITWANKVFADKFGGEDKVKGKKLPDLLGLSAEQSGRCPASLTFDTGKPTLAEWELDGKEVLIAAVPVPQPDSESKEALVFALDMSSQRRAQRALRRRNSELTVLREISSLADKTFDGRILMTKALPRMVEPLGYDFAAYYALSPAGRSFTLLADSLSDQSLGPLPRTIDQGGVETLRTCLGKKEFCISTKRTRCPHMPRALTDYIEQQSIELLAVFPIKTAARLFGLLILGRRRAMLPEKEEEAFLVSMSMQISATLERIKLFETLQRNLVDVMELQKAGYFMSSTRDRQAIVGSLCNSILNIMEFAAVIIELNDSLAGAYLKHGDDIATLAVSDFLFDTLWSEEIDRVKNLAIMTKLPKFCTPQRSVLVKVGNLPGRDHFCFRSLGVFPLISKDRVHGVVKVFSSTEGKFVAEINSVLQTIISQAAMALENATLIENLERTMKEVSEKERFLENVIESSSDGVLVTDGRGNMVRMNKALCELLGLKRGKVCSLFEILGSGPAGQGESDFAGFMEYLCKHGPTKLQERKIKRAEGSEITVEMSITPYRDDKENPAGVIVIVRDISERQALQDRLFQTEKLSALGEVISGVAHELNNPLTGVIGFSELLAKKSDLDDNTREKVLKILREADRCRRIVNNLLEFSRMRPSQRRAVNINRLIDEVLELKGYELKVSNIEVRKRFAPNLPETAGDPQLLQQVIFNIINNAHQALTQQGKGGVLTITTNSGSGSITVSIKDNGPGIPRQLQAKIFDPFFTTKGPGKGTGLGLSLSYKIIERHAGTIKVESTPGRGATFTVTLPILAAKPTQKAATRLEAPIPVRPGRILVVDDEQAIVDLVAEMLRGEEHHISLALNANEALDKLSQQDFDCIISDIRMPEMDGRELYCRVKELKPETAEKLIFITGDLLNDATEKFVSESGIPFLKKPFTAQELRQSVHRILARNVAANPGPAEERSTR